MRVVLNAPRGRVESKQTPGGPDPELSRTIFVNCVHRVVGFLRAVAAYIKLSECCRPRFESV
jgi:hypothetical protein